MNKILFAFYTFLFSVFTLQVAALDWDADNIPMVHLQDARRYVSDPDGIMSPAMRDSTDSYLRRLEKEAGIQTVFVIVSHVKNGDAFRVAEDIGNKYGVGDRKTRRGLVVVVAVDDKKYFIAPGNGLEGDLTDVDCDDIAQACIVRNMRAGDVDEAMLSTAKAVYNKFKTGKTGIEGVSDDGVHDVVIVILFLVVFFWIVWAKINHDDDNHRGGNNGHGRDRFGGVPFIFWGNPGGTSGSGFSGGGSFGGGSFGGGGSGGGW